MVPDSSPRLPAFGVVNAGKRDDRTLSELAEETGIPARTIRFYIARGLLEGPVRGGRGAVYTAKHAERLAEIRRLQAGGKMLSEIAAVVAGGKEPRELPEPSAWWQYPLSDDVVVWVRASASPWRLRQIRSGLADLTARLRREPGKPDEEV